MSLRMMGARRSIRARTAISASGAAITGVICALNQKPVKKRSKARRIFSAPLASKTVEPKVAPRG
jgi:hypothetical protein